MPRSESGALEDEDEDLLAAALVSIGVVGWVVG
jgi:hypothetical protein